MKIAGTNHDFHSVHNEFCLSLSNVHLGMCSKLTLKRVIQAAYSMRD